MVSRTRSYSENATLAATSRTTPAAWELVAHAISHILEACHGGVDLLLGDRPGVFAARQQRAEPALRVRAQEAERPSLADDVDEPGPDERRVLTEELGPRLALLA